MEKGFFKGIFKGNLFQKALSLFLVFIVLLHMYANFTENKEDEEFAKKMEGIAFKYLTLKDDSYAVDDNINALS